MKSRKTGERVLISFDYALKRLLRNKANYEVLEGFLSELLKDNVSVKSIGESESNKEHATDKHNRVDILVEAESNEIMLIELQFTPEIDYLHRMLYGTSKTITERMVQGSEYLEVKKIYSINIVYFDLGHGKDYIYRGKTNFIGLHENDELYLSKPQRDAFNKETASDIYPEYFVLKVNNFNDTMKDRFDEWVYFLKHNVIKDEFKAKGLVKARKILDRDLLTPEEQRAYDDAWWQRSEDLSAVASSKLEGRIEGREEGREEGKIEREKLMEELEALMKKLENERQERENERKEREKERQERENERKEREKEQVELKKLARNYEILLAEIARLKRKKQK